MNYPQQYMHVERLERRETRGLLDGVCHIQAKLDGTNAVIWSEDGVLTFGSRKRVLGFDQPDNHGFRKAMLACDETRAWLLEYFADFPDNTLFGEWLVPHTLKNYEDDAWRKFYMFDVMHIGELRQPFIPDGCYMPPLVVPVPVLATLKNPTMAQIKEVADANTYLMKEGYIGEGVVIKRYDFENSDGRTIWGKYVRDEFKLDHGQKVKVAKPSDGVEFQIVDKFLTKAMIDKVLANMEGEWEQRRIGQLLGTTYYDFIREESWAFIKKFNSPTINYRDLQRATNLRVKALFPELF